MEKRRCLELLRVVRVVGIDCMGLHFENVPLAHARKIQEFLLPLILAVEAEVKPPCALLCRLWPRGAGW